MDFNQVIGHDRAIEALKKSVRKGNISHSYLFEGGEGLGKKMTALVFAKTLLCKEGKEEPCNRCNSCIKFDGGNHPDFVLLEPENGLIKKGEIEALIKSVAMAPFESKKKVFIIDDSHKMNPEGKNALLKTLEEPPGYINIILISSSANYLLPTILSRCQIIRFYPVENSKIVRLLTNKYNKSEDEAQFIAGFTKGAIGKAIKLSADDEFFTLRDEILKIIDDIVTGDKIKALTSMEFFNDNKENIDDILNIILYWFRDLLIFKEIGSTDLLLNRDKLEYLSKESFMDLTKINDIIERVQETKENIRRKANYQLSIETMLLNIQEEYL